MGGKGNDSVFDELQKFRNVATILSKEIDYRNEKLFESERQHELVCNDLKEARNLIAILSNEIDNKNGKLFFLETKLEKASSALEERSVDNDRLRRLFFERTRQREVLVEENRRLHSKLELQMREFKRNLEKRVSQNDSERRILLLEKQKVMPFYASFVNECLMLCGIWTLCGLDLRDLMQFGQEWVVWASGRANRVLLEFGLEK